MTAWRRPGGPNDPTPTRAIAARPAGAGSAASLLPVGWSLRTKLALLLALAIALVIGVTTYLQSRVFERTVEGELSETARLTALAVADDLELREGPFNAEELTQTLREFVETVPEFGAITVVTLDTGQPIVFASTATGTGSAAVEAQPACHRAARSRVEQHGDAGARSSRSRSPGAGSRSALSP